MMSIIELGEKTRIKTFHPPVGLDPLTASPKELAQAGFPARPTDIGALASYNRFFTHNKNLRHIEPTFGVRSNTRPSRHRLQTEDLLQDFSDNWSGVLVHPPSGDSIRWVTAQWNVPFVTPSANDGLESADCWVGIDGWGPEGSHDVAQAGVECTTRRNGTEIETDYYTWFEWWPDSPEHKISTTITNFPVSAGDSVGVTICAENGFRGEITVARVFFANPTKGISISFEIESPQDVSLSGLMAEFIVETPTFNNAYVGMPNYNDVLFTDAMAGTAAGKIVYPRDGDTVYLQRHDAAGDPVGPVLSRGEIAGLTSVRCVYTGPR
jgi:hypothetical protein